MMRFGYICTLSVGLLALVLSSVGCADQEKENLKRQNASLTEAVSTAHGDTEKMRAERDQMARDKEAKDLEIARLQADLAKKGGGAPTGTSTGGTAAGWQNMTIGDRVTLDSDILFSAGREDLTADGKKHLDKIVADIKKNYAGMPIRVYGYTDTDPIKKTKDKWIDNLDLSMARAASVTRYLSSKGIKSSMVETIGMGENFSLGSNKAKSRRVEIIVIKAAGAAAPKSAGKAALPIPPED